MKRGLSSINLNTGEKLAVSVVQTPDKDYKEQIWSFLAPYHHHEIWRWHMSLTFNNELDDLETRFYLGIVNDRIVGNITTWEFESSGVLGHVYTAEHHRRKGIFRAILTKCMKDFIRRGGKTLILGTPVDAQWNHVYVEQGFRQIVDGSEVMTFGLRPSHVDKAYRSQKVFSRKIKWSDWPSLSFLYVMEEGWKLRSMVWNIIGPYDYEDYFLHDMKRIQEEKCQAHVLLTEKGDVVGHSVLSLTNDHSGGWLLDFFVHPLYTSKVKCLLGSLQWPVGEVRCYVERDNPEKKSLLLEMSFEKEASSKHFNEKGKETELIMMERFFR